MAIKGACSVYCQTSHSQYLGQCVSHHFMLWYPEDILFGSVDRDRCLDARLRPRGERTVCFPVLSMGFNG